MRIQIGYGDDDTFNKPIEVRDVILIPNLFCDDKDMSIYKKLLSEIISTGLTDVFKLWHGDTHLIADDNAFNIAPNGEHIKWKEMCPTFNMIVEKMAKYFKMEVKATRFNLYQDGNDFKPKHFDAAAVDPQKARTQNLTVAVSFGITRDVEFEHAKTRTTIRIPLPNGYTYAFARDTNILFRHGIPPLPCALRDKMASQPKEQVNNAIKGDTKSNGRISIVAWGCY